MLAVEDLFESRPVWTEPLPADDQMRFIERDRAVSLEQANSTPALLAVVEAYGVWIRDAAGKEYCDFYGNNCHHVGYRNPRVVQAVRQQLEKCAFVSRGLTNETSIRLAEKLSAHYPVSGSKVMFVPGGAAAVEVALTIAKANTGRYKTVSFWDSYHGRSAGALSVSGSPRDKSARLGPLLPGAIQIPPFYWAARGPGSNAADMEASAERSLEFLREVFRNEEGGVAALIAEPVRNGPYVPPPSYWAAVRELCDRAGCLLIFDDIPMGLGKTGWLFNCERFGVAPDMTVIGKALGGAVAPLAAVLADARLDTTQEMNLGYYTHEKNALSAAAGLATLTVLVDFDLARRARRLEALVSDRLSALKAANPIVSNVRAIGLMFAVDLGRLEAGGERLARRLHRELLLQGLLAMPPKRNTVSFSAPLIVGEQELDHALSVLERAVSVLTAEAASSDAAPD